MDESYKNFDENGEDTLKNRYMTFLLDKETYGVEIRYVREIIGIQTITELPEMPDYMKGIINLRGNIIPVICVRTRFNKPPQVYDDRTCIIVIDYNGVSVGFIVDSVSAVMTLQESEISERPNLNTGGRGYVNRIGKAEGTVILLLDCGKLLNAAEYELLLNAI